MKKRVFVYIFIFSVCLLHLLIQDAAVGEQLATSVSMKYKTLLSSSSRAGDIQKLFPAVLSSLKSPTRPLNYTLIGLIANNPNFLKSYVPNVDDQFLDLLKIDDDLRLFLREDNVRNLILDSDEIDALLQLIDRTPLPPEFIEIFAGDDQTSKSKTELQPFVVVVKNQNNISLPDVNVVFSVTKGKLSSTTARTDNAGQAKTTLTLGSEVGIYKVKASVVGYPELMVTFTAAATTAEPEPPPPTTLEIVSGDNQTGKAGMPLAQPFIVGVKDRGGKAFAGADVTFRITRGGGKFPDDGSPTIVKTNPYGQASVTLTLGSNVGVNLVEATLTDPTHRQNNLIIGNKLVTFSATAKSDTLPTVYWIEDGKIFRKLPGTDKELLKQPEANWTATSLAVTGNKIYWTEHWTATSLAVTGNKIYWTEQQNRGGRIRSASLNGKKARTLRTLEHGVPNGIVANPVTHRLYWTYSPKNQERPGRIQSINFNGTGFKGFLITNFLGMPKHIALAVKDSVADGVIYWTAYDNNKGWGIWRSSPDGNIQTKELLTLGELGELKGLAVAGNKLYWGEETGEGQGKVRSAYLNGSSAKTLHVLEGSIPAGIAVDAGGSKLYWTSSSGSVQRLNLDEPIQIVATNLEKPTGIALGSAPGLSVPASPAAPPTIVKSSDQNALLANYPNPFNPETWIPYQLSEPADVSVSIYSVNGHLIRTLALGHQSAGNYRSKSRAAYWDGCNAFGERVASGLYFYTLTAGDFTATRKMLIRK